MNRQNCLLGSIGGVKSEWRADLGARGILEPAGTLERT